MNAPGAFSDAVQSIEATIARERTDPAIDPRCVSVLLHHARPTDRVIVLFHGFTNCPRQFASLAERLFNAGFGVYIPRLPRHGMADRLTTVLGELTVDELTDCARTAIKLAGPLAARTTALGLSVGGTLVAWLAQRYTLECALAIAPFFSMTHVATLFEPAVAQGLMLAPNLELWWDPREKAALGPDHGYPRFPTHALARCLQLGASVRELARTAIPLAARSTLVLNAKDPAIDNSAARDVWQLWRDRGGCVAEYTFENLDERHDIIEPQTYPAAATLVYPVLETLLGI